MNCLRKNAENNGSNAALGDATAKSSAVRIDETTEKRNGAERSRSSAASALLVVIALECSQVTRSTSYEYNILRYDTHTISHSLVVAALRYEQCALADFIVGLPPNIQIKGAPQNWCAE